MKPEEIEHIFTYHPPQPGQPEKYQKIREICKAAAHQINVVCPESREKSLAITQLQLASMMANAAIAIHDKPNSDVPV